MLAIRIVEFWNKIINEGYIFDKVPKMYQDNILNLSQTYYKFIFQQIYTQAGIIDLDSSYKSFKSFRK